MSIPAPRIETWLGVPHGSSMHISVHGTTQRELVVASVFALRGDGRRDSHSDAQLQPGPLRILLEVPHRYSFEVDLVFGTDATAIVAAGVLGPTGETIAPLLATPIAGSRGDVQSVRLFVTTL